ncbi:flagellar filament capping protein FliD [Photorhabdus laumondii subsp. laumondii]|uniref:Flagellar hook-associated protein 2 n=2 Tax=Photorhabdus laumondii subsp. laumondii TaxID=141679 RepID=Q7N5J5_PHOLL|nr:MULTISPECIES: flagellar filament capping protein FliD [Photorhabdus]AWK41756.1 flagellar filament capping protein FliD [Photorhabdus laumondii subsp. laumondii]AXG42575.1 flagellar filament capping protein FliD [Photorhabdus laumondii subsp. laumondii]AXG47077.1 flagellar filament capping protein FliD [Photorhabdus laumondii subsp. laumondii]KTL60960.1 flagellar cap protein FliD [Photorhabdus laumondii subsp. laumondii]MCC8382493.1 flagellar filament capping protein FliD [Photorhabdus laumo
MASISSLGAGSGMDLGSILDKLQAAEQKRLVPLAQQQTSYKGKLTAFGTLKGSLEKLETASESLKKFDKLNTTTASEKHDAFVASTDSKASPGNYSIEVKQLAQAQSLQTEKVSNIKEYLGESLGEGKTRTITITQPGEKKPMKIELTDGQTSIIEIRDAINKQEGNVNASIIKAKDGENYLVLTAKKAGTESVMTIKVEGDNKLSELLNYPGTTSKLTQTVEAKNAKLTVNKIPIERQTNHITDAPEGVKLDLKKTTEDKDKPGEHKPEILVISRDIEPMKEAIKNWVDAYNELQTTFDSLTKFKPVKQGEEPSKDNGALLGDSTLRGIQNQLRSQIFSSQAANDIPTLNKLGIKQKPDGKLEIDNEKLEKNLKEKPTNVKAFFMGDGKKTGFATQTHKLLKDALDSHEGTLATATDGINKRLKTLDQQVDRTKQNINETIERYKRQFSQLDKMVSSLGNTGNFLSQLQKIR